MMRTGRYLLTLGVLWCGLSPTLGLRADDEPLPEAKPADKVEAPADPIADELLEGQTAAEKPEEKVQQQLDKISSKMQQAQDKLRGKDLSEPAGKVHQELLSDIDELLKALQQPPPPQSSNSSSSSGSSNSQSNSQRNQSRQNGQPRGGDPSQAQPKPAGQGQGSQAGKDPQGSQPQTAADQARDSDENVKSKQRAAAEQAARQRLLKDVWGHLPPNVRQELLNVYSEKYLPKYEDLVRKYYAALAEQGEK